MHKIRILTSFIVSFILILGLLGKIQAQGGNSKKFDIPTIHIVDAIKEGKIKVEATGAGLTTVTVKIKRNVNEKFRVVVAPGTFFINQGTAQDMVSTDQVRFTFIKDREATITIPVACANALKDVPDESSTFTIERLPRSKDLEKLVKVFPLEKASAVVKQVAVWIVTDDIDNPTLDTRFVKACNQFICDPDFFIPGGGCILKSNPDCPLVLYADGWKPKRNPAASITDKIHAMKLVERSGIDVTQKAIFNEGVLIEGLVSKRKIAKQYSATKLGVHPNERVPFLVGYLKNSENPELTRRAIKVLGEIGDPSAINPLLQFLREQLEYSIKSPEAGNFKAAAKALGNIGNRQAVQPLIEILESNEDKEGLKSFQIQSIVEALGMLRDPRALAPLLTALENSNDTGVRRAVGESVATIGTALADIGDKRGVEPLLTVLWLGEIESKYDDIVIKALGKYKDDRAVKPLLSYWAQLKEHDWRTKKLVINSLVQITHKQFGDNLSEWESWWETTKEKGS